MAKSTMKKTLLLGAAVGLVAPVVAIATEQAAFAASTCGANAQNPHHSSGANGVVAKTDFACFNGPSYGSSVTYNMLLWLCQANPPQDENVLAAYCYNVGQTNGTIQGMQPWVPYTRVVPPVGQPGAKGVGYWMQCTGWTGDDGVFHMEFSQTGVFLCEK